MTNRTIADRINTAINTGKEAKFYGTDDLLGTGTEYDFTHTGLASYIASLAQTQSNKVFEDSTTSFVDNGDNTKALKFQVSGITTATTRTVTWPDADLTVVGLATTQTLTNKTLTAPTITTPTVTAPVLQPLASATPASNGDVVIEATANTTLTFKLKGSDGTVRSGTITLS